MLSKNSDPKRILIVSMTNIGDVVLSCPVIDILCKDFPKAKIDVVVGPKAVSLFEGNPNFKVKVFEKHGPLSDRFAWFMDLFRSGYDCVVDLRRTMLPILLLPRYSTPAINFKSIGGHKKEIHLNRLSQIYYFDQLPEKRYAIQTLKADEDFFKSIVIPFTQGQNFVVMAPGAASSNKRWPVAGWPKVADYFSQQYKIVFVGDDKDAKIVEEIQQKMHNPSLSLAGKINLRELAYILQQASWALTHDSGVMHLASYFNVPQVVLWGPTDFNRYAPWSDQFVVVRRNENCERCQNPKKDVEHNCMSFIQPEDVIEAGRSLAIQ